MPACCDTQLQAAFTLHQDSAARAGSAAITLHRGCAGAGKCSTHSKVPTGKATSLLPLVLSPTVVLMIRLRPTSASLATVRSLFNSRFCSSQRGCIGGGMPSTA